jgi:hypothetical protein
LDIARKVSVPEARLPASTAIDGFDPRVQTTIMFGPAVRSTLALVAIGSLSLDASALAESLQVLITVAVIDSGAEAEPAMVGRGDPSVIAITIKKKMN